MSETNNNILEEYKTLREEHLYYTKSRDQISFLLLTGIYFFTVYFFSKKLCYLFYYIPIILTLYTFTYYKIRTLFNDEILSYIKVVIEEELNGLKWHKKKEKFNLGCLDYLGKVLHFFIFLIPVILSFYKIFEYVTNKFFHVISLFGVIILFLSIYIISYKKEKKLDDTWLNSNKRNNVSSE